MNYKNIKLLLILTFIFSIQGLTAQSNEQDAVYRDVVIEYQLNEDGSTTYHYSHKLKLLTNNAFRRQYGETFIVYNPEYQKLTVNKSETTTADGTKINSPDNAFNEVLPGFCANAPAYNHLREMVITHTGLEIGAEISLDYQIETKNGLIPGLMGEEVLANTSPIKNAIIRVTMPAGKDLHYELFNHDAKAQIKNEGNIKIYEWKFENLPAVYPELNLPEKGNFAPRLTFSSFKDFNEAFASVLSQPAFDVPENKELNIFVHKLQAESTSDLDFMMKLQKKIITGITTYHIPFIHTGFKARTPIEVWNSSAGTEFEKTVLFCSLLKAAGFPAESVFISHLSPFSQNTASLMAFNQVMAHSKIDGQCIVFPVDHEISVHLPFQNPGKSIALLYENSIELKQIPALKTEQNTTQLNAVLKLKDNEISGNATLTLSGAANPYFTFYRDGNKLKNLISGAMGASDPEKFKVISMNKVKSSATASVKIENPFTTQGDYLFWKIPGNPKGFDSWHLAALSQQRIHPFELPHPLKEDNKISIELPENITLVTPQKKIKIDNNIGSVTIEIIEAHEIVQITRTLTLNKQTIPVTDYKDLLELWRLWESEAYRELCFKKK